MRAAGAPYPPVRAPACPCARPTRPSTPPSSRPARSNALNTRLGQLGFELGEEQLNDVFKRFKQLADHKKVGGPGGLGRGLGGWEACRGWPAGSAARCQLAWAPNCPPTHPLSRTLTPPRPRQNITDEDVLALLSDEVHQPAVVWHLEDLQVVCGSMGMPTATVRMRGPDGISRVASGIGSGPVDAAYKVGGCWVQGGAHGAGRQAGGGAAAGLVAVAVRGMHRLLDEAPLLPAGLTCRLLAPLPSTLPSPASTRQAIDSLVRVQAELLDYSVNSVTGGWHGWGPAWLAGWLGHRPCYVDVWRPAGQRPRAAVLHVRAYCLLLRAA